MFTFYLVGGAVRDTIMNLTCKDYDFTAVYQGEFKDTLEVFHLLREYLISRDIKIVVEIPICLVIKVKINQLICDINLARKENTYIPNTRISNVEYGTLYDDMIRRDFTINALAQDYEGNVIDYFNGISDVHNKILRTVINTETSFQQDPLRICRAIRFVITKGFIIPQDISNIIHNYDYNNMSRVPLDKILKELNICLEHDTCKTLQVLSMYPKLQSYVCNIIKLKAIRV